MIGLDVVASGWRHRQPGVYGFAQSNGVIELLERMAAEGAVGMKSGHGFYAYPPGPNLSAGEGVGQAGEVLVVALCYGATRLILGGVADRDTVNKAWKLGTDARVGPLELLTKIAAERRQAMLAEAVSRQYLEAEHGEQIGNWWQIHLQASKLD